MSGLDVLCFALGGMIALLVTFALALIVIVGIFLLLGPTQ